MCDQPRCSDRCGQLAVGAAAAGALVITVVAVHAAPALETAYHVVTSVLTVAIAVVAAVITALAALAIFGRVRGYSAMSGKVLAKLGATAVAIPGGAAALAIGLGFGIAPALIVVSTLILSGRVLLTIGQACLQIRASEHHAALSNQARRQAIDHSGPWRPAVAPVTAKVLASADSSPAIEGAVPQRPPAV